MVFSSLLEHNRQCGRKIALYSLLADVGDRSHLATSSHQQAEVRWKSRLYQRRREVGPLQVVVRHRTE